jgi:peptidyl-prolyl isomerase H (cyclophilin H)
VEIELFSQDLPRTSENFRQFCTGEFRQQQQPQPIGYKNCTFHRVIKDFMIQGGDFVSGNGVGTQSIYGRCFDDESFKYDHHKYYVSMANSGPNSNGCQFFILLKDTLHLDGKHVVFGKVIDGFETVDAIGRIPVKQDKPTTSVTIVDCGEY